MAFLQYAVAILFVIMSAAKSECQRGWVHFGNSCYFFSTRHKSWLDAATFCRAYHSELASVETRAENDFMTDTINRIKNGLSKKRNSDPDFWIGGTDAVIEGLWIWAASGKAITYSNFHDNAPDNLVQNNPDGQNCLEIVQWTGKVGKWNDDNCLDESHFICEMEFPASGGGILG
ncbi:perlucin-like [Mytilus galloprovincialis]|uniref:perlucin-like n=1 Tax=Mytilus galloprovincialis TaxID=29158 RepID=UPI003F7BBF4A